MSEMRPHNGKTKTGFREGRNKVRSSKKPVEPENKQSRKKTLDDAQEVVEDYMDSALLEEGDPKKKSERFAKEFRRLRKQVGADNEHFNPEQVNNEMLRALLAMVVSLIPVAEANYRSSRKESAAYALNALINQAREVSTDLRMAKDYEGQASFIRDNILSPIFRAFTQNLLNEHQHLKNTIDTAISREKEARKIKAELDDVTRSLGKFLSETITKSFVDIDNYLQGNMQNLMPTGGNKPKRSKKGR